MKLKLILISILFSNCLLAESIIGSNLEEQMKYIGDKKVDQVTYCFKTASSITANGNQCSWEWEISNCSNGLPRGECFSVLSRTSHSGGDEDWRSINPGEEYTSSNIFSNGGMGWYNSSGCTNTSLFIAAIYFCKEVN